MLLALAGQYDAEHVVLFDILIVFRKYPPDLKRGDRVEITAVRRNIFVQPRGKRRPHKYIFFTDRIFQFHQFLANIRIVRAEVFAYKRMIIYFVHAKRDKLLADLVFQYDLVFEARRNKMDVRRGRTQIPKTVQPDHFFIEVMRMFNIGTQRRNGHQKHAHRNRHFFIDRRNHKTKQFKIRPHGLCVELRTQKCITFCKFKLHHALCLLFRINIHSTFLRHAHDFLQKHFRADGAERRKLGTQRTRKTGRCISQNVYGAGCLINAYRIKVRRLDNDALGVLVYLGQFATLDAGNGKRMFCIGYYQHIGRQGNMLIIKCRDLLSVFCASDHKRSSL